jgi:hypothetical protein
VLYLYAIVEKGRRLPGAGLWGAPSQAIEQGELAAVVSEHEDLSRPLDEDELWAHEKVVEELMEHGAVLPMRAGSVLADAAGVRALLDEQSDRFRRGLERVRGAVELGVRAAGVAAAPKVAAGVRDDEGPGTAYMRARLDSQIRSDLVASRVHAALRGLARDHVSLSKSLAAGDARSAYLVDRDEVEAFISRVEKLGRELDDVSIVCTGPWPPYNFVGSPA